MLYLEAQHIKKYYAERLIIAFDILKIYRGDKIGLVVANGAGKTTLLNILAGKIQPDRGVVKSYCQIAYIRQFSEEEPWAGDKTLAEFDLKGKPGKDLHSGGGISKAG